MIYVRGDSIPFVITGKSVGTNPVIFGYWNNDPKEHRTDLSRLVADGGINEIDEILKHVPCPVHGLTGEAICSLAHEETRS